MTLNDIQLQKVAHFISPSFTSHNPSPMAQGTQLGLARDSHLLQLAHGWVPQDPWMLVTRLVSKTCFFWFIRCHKEDPVEPFNLWKKCDLRVSFTSI